MAMNFVIVDENLKLKINKFKKNSNKLIKASLLESNKLLFIIKVRTNIFIMRLV